MNGDFSAFNSAACNSGNAVTLRAPFVNNQIDPALFSPAALNLATRLVASAPTPNDDCGEVTYGARSEENRKDFIFKVDYQASSNHSLFARGLMSKIDKLHPFGLDPTCLRCTVTEPAPRRTSSETT